jgi:hypothetical protein
MVASTANPSSRPAITTDVGTGAWEAAIVDAARAVGRSLVQLETDTGQVVWSWSRADGTGPLFLTRRVALTWMADLLERAEPQDI